MGLKSFHVFFIVASIGLSVGFGYWCIQEYLVSGDLPTLALAIGSLACGAAMVGYSRWFLRKLKGVGYL
jgi:hypothetical protein